VTTGMSWGTARIRGLDLCEMGARDQRRKTQKRRWKMPQWMEQYRHLIFGKYRIEDFMSCDGVNCNIEVNAPRALLCTALQERVNMLMVLHKAGRLK